MQFALSTPQIATPVPPLPVPAASTPKALGRPRQPRALVGETKTCTRCSKSKDLSEFAIKRGSRAAHCRDCQKAMSDAHYQRNKAQIMADVAARNEGYRDQLAAARDAYLANCLCENCTGTVDLQLTTREGYEGESAHEVVSGAGSMQRLVAAIENSRVLCKPCMGGKYGKEGGPLRQALRKMAMGMSDSPATAQEMRGDPVVA